MSEGEAEVEEINAKDQEPIVGSVDVSQTTDLEVTTNPLAGLDNAFSHLQLRIHEDQTLSESERKAREFYLQRARRALRIENKTPVFVEKDGNPLVERVELAFLRGQPDFLKQVLEELGVESVEQDMDSLMSRVASEKTVRAARPTLDLDEAPEDFMVKTKIPGVEVGLAVAQSSPHHDRRERRLGRGNALLVPVPALTIRMNEVDLPPFNNSSLPELSNEDNLIFKYDAHDTAFNNLMLGYGTNLAPSNIRTR